MPRPRGRPPKRLNDQQKMLARRIARDLGVDLDAPAAHPNDRTMSREEERQMRRSRVADWALDAYRTYVHLLREGLPVGPTYLSGHVEIPEEILAIPPRTRRPLPFAAVARWAYRRRVLGESLDAITETQVDYEPRIDRLAELRGAVVRAQADGDEEESRYLEELLEITRWQSGADADVRASSESIRKAIARNRRIWEIAEREFPPS